MILRIVLGLIAPGTEPATVADLHAGLVRAARDIAGLESLIFGTRRPPKAPPEAPVEAAVVTVWRDPDSMVRATGANEQGRFLGERLRLVLSMERADHYEIMGRTFGALPQGKTAYLRIVRVRSRPNEESALMDTLRAQQPRLVELGLVASHLGRRVVGAEVEAVSVGVWPDRAAIRAATSGGPEAPLFAHELEAWADRLTLDTYDGLEIAPRLPVASGPSIFIIDDDLLIVDITSSAAAALGSPAQDLVGRSLHELSMTDRAEIAGRRAMLLEEGTITGEATWVVPEAGRVFLRFVGRRDVPIPGRHAVLVRRISEPMPTLGDLEAAIREAFPGVELQPPDHAAEGRAADPADAHLGG